MPREYSKHQQKIIKNYYDNREQIDAQRLSELVTNLYLAKGKKREKFWETARDVMQGMKIPPSRIEHVLQSNDPVTLADVVNDLQSGKLP